MHRPIRYALGCALLLLTGCAGTTARDAAPPATAYPPEACGAGFPADAPVLKLAATTVPEKDAPVAFGKRIAVDRSLTRAGGWTDRPDGWSTLALVLQSAGARSLSLHLSELQLPPRTELWLCSPDGRVRHGPYREATGGELWTPVVPGEQASLQIWVPSTARHALKGTLADVQSGYR